MERDKRVPSRRVEQDNRDPSRTVERDNRHASRTVERDNRDPSRTVERDNRDPEIAAEAGIDHGFIAWLPCLAIENRRHRANYLYIIAVLPSNSHIVYSKPLVKPAETDATHFTVVSDGLKKCSEQKNGKPR